MPTAEKKSVITIYAEATPNPQTLKFVCNKMLVERGVFEFENAEEAEKSPLAEGLFKLDFVKGVFIMSNFVSITKDPGYKWVDLIPSLKPHIKEFIESGQPIVSEELLAQVEEGPADGDSAAVVKIKQILNNQVKPAVEGDGGFIEFESFEDGIVKLILRGACSGCPSSMVTLKAGIEGMLKRFVPEVKEVQAVAM